MTHHRIVIGQGTLVHADGQRRGRGGPRGAAVGANHSAGGVVVRGGTTPAASPAPAATRTAPALVQGRNTFRAIQEDGLGLWVIASKCRDLIGLTAVHAFEWLGSAGRFVRVTCRLQLDFVIEVQALGFRV